MSLEKELREFKPKLKFLDLDFLTGSHPWEPKEIANTGIYNLVRQLTSHAFPTSEDEFDKSWEDFYLPLRRDGRFISLPFWVQEYNEEFTVALKRFGLLHIKRGDNEVEEDYKHLFEDVLRFIPLIRVSNNQVLRKTVPYDLRTGKIKGRFFMKKLLPERTKKRLLKSYKEHLEKKLEVAEISLNDYLNVAAICYKATEKRETEGLTPLEMYKKWADFRHGGMLDIKNPDSKEEFKEWYLGKKRQGSHPFEISSDLIRLYPPDINSPYYRFSLEKHGYFEYFAKLINAFIINEVPFQANNFEEALDYLAGDTIFTVNDSARDSFYYIPSRESKKLYFHHIEWDELKIPQWK